MSSFEDYSRTSENYDETRAAVGVEIILGCLAAAGRPFCNFLNQTATS